MTQPSFYKTVGELRAALEEYPDDMLVGFRGEYSEHTQEMFGPYVYRMDDDWMRIYDEDYHGRASDEDLEEDFPNTVLTFT